MMKNLFEGGILKNIKKEHSQEEVAKLEKSRAADDAELLKGGAEYKVNESGEKILEPTKEQINAMESEMFAKEIIADPEITSAKSAINKLKSLGYGISEDAKGVLKEIDWEKRPEGVYKVVVVSVGELFGDATEKFPEESYHSNTRSFSEIKAAANKSGLDFIPASLIPEIRAAYGGTGQKTYFAMDPIDARENFLVKKDPRILSCSNRKDVNFWTDPSKDPDAWLDQRVTITNYSDNFSLKDRFFFIKK